ncbi:hypothetical protein MRX96_026747 [Rhipicephalus microplus]
MEVHPQGSAPRLLVEVAAQLKGGSTGLTRSSVDPSLAEHYDDVPDNDSSSLDLGNISGFPDSPKVDYELAAGVGHR